MFGLGPQEILILVVIGVLLFGSNLPQLGRSLGKTIVEFRNGMRGIETDVDAAASAPPSAPAIPAAPPPRIAPSAVKFTAADGEPVVGA